MLMFNQISRPFLSVTVNVPFAMARLMLAEIPVRRLPETSAICFFPMKGIVMYAMTVAESVAMLKPTET